ncbi:hypothetical protein HMPREF1602_00163 [Escherichia coli 907889]|nr:hypothetical protein HMPREF1602_00163 [Escherichia coli 907889]CSQ01194.1 Uncharacterised protein [Shigella sonnei]
MLAFVNSLLTWLITTYNDLPLIPDRQMQLTSRNRIIFQYFLHTNRARIYGCRKNYF